jgi:hypothetical protein
MALKHAAPQNPPADFNLDLTSSVSNKSITCTCLLRTKPGEMTARQFPYLSHDGNMVIE